MDEKYINFLHIAVLMLTIQAKIIAINMENINISAFSNKWMEFIEKDLIKSEEIKFMLDKLYFMHYELEQTLFFGYAKMQSNLYLKKIINSKKKNSNLYVIVIICNYMTKFYFIGPVNSST